MARRSGKPYEALVVERVLTPLKMRAQLFKTTPQFWMHMQADFDLKAAMVRRRALKLAKKS